jgi:flagellar protein FliL
MVANRMDMSKEPSDKTEKPQAAAGAAPTGGGGGIKAWVPLLATLLVMPAVAYAVTSFVLLPKLQHGLGVSPHPAAAAAPEGKNAKEPEAKKETAALTKLVVNVAGTMGSRYIMTSLTLVGPGADLKTRVEHNDAQLRDAAGGVLSTKSLPDLERPGARNLLRSELISAFNSVLGAGTVQEIYLTEFAVQ